MIYDTPLEDALTMTGHALLLLLTLLKPRALCQMTDLYVIGKASSRGEHNAGGNVLKVRIAHRVPIVTGQELRT